MSDQNEVGKAQLDYGSLLTALHQASGFDLFRLRAVIDKELNDPKRLSAMRAQLKVGQELDYFETAENRLRPCRIKKLSTKYAHVVDLDNQQPWRLPYYMLNLENADVRINEEVEQGLSRHSLSVGDWVGFKDKQGIEHTGQVIRLNSKSATVSCNEDQGGWRVGYGLLYRVLDGEATNEITPDLFIEGKVE